MSFCFQVTSSHNLYVCMYVFSQFEIQSSYIYGMGVAWGNFVQFFLILNYKLLHIV